MNTTFKFPETDVVGCRFPVIGGRNSEVEVDPKSKEYFYKLLPGQPKPKLGDFVVTACVNGFQVCVVTTLNAMTSFKDIAYVVGTVDGAAYREELHRQEMKKRLHAELMAKKKELEESVTLDLLAEKSPEFKAILDAYRSFE